MHYKYCAECGAALIGVHQCCPNGCIQPPGEHIKIQNQNTPGPIAGIWRKGPAPKDGTKILGLFGGDAYVVYYDCWPVGGETPSPGNPGCPEDSHECAWCVAGRGDYFDQDEPDAWATIVFPSEQPPGPIANRIADSYARLIERAEKAEAERDTLRDALKRLAAGEDAPRVPMLAAGVEDRDLQADGYAAVEYGWQDAEERYMEWIKDEVAAVLAELEAAE